MNKTFIVSITMRDADKIQKTVYGCDDPLLNAEQVPVHYPINAFAKNNIRPEDDVTLILVSKYKAGESLDIDVKPREQLFLDEFYEMTGNRDISVLHVYSPFSEKCEVHEHLLYEIVSRIPENSHIYTDITFGPKDIPIVFLSVFDFASRFLGCEIENIIYGQGFFDKNGDFTSSLICDMSALYSLNALNNVITCQDPKKALELLATLVNIKKD